MRRGQYLVTDDRAQLFEISQVVESCLSLSTKLLLASTALALALFGFR